MSFDPQKSAREKTPFGEFQLHRSHLKTGRIGKRYTAAEIKKRAEDKERRDTQARWAAAGCTPLEET